MSDHCLKCGSVEIIFIEYPPSHHNHYDGISEFKCQNCGLRIGRWTGKILQDGETEKPYGGKPELDGSRSPYFWN